MTSPFSSFLKISPDSRVLVEPDPKRTRKGPPDFGDTSHGPHVGITRSEDLFTVFSVTGTLTVGLSVMERFGKGTKSLAL